MKMLKYLALASLLTGCRAEKKDEGSQDPKLKHAVYSMMGSASSKIDSLCGITNDYNPGLIKRASPGIHSQIVDQYKNSGYDLSLIIDSTPRVGGRNGHRGFMNVEVHGFDKDGKEFSAKKDINCPSL